MRMEVVVELGIVVFGWGVGACEVEGSVGGCFGVTLVSDVDVVDCFWDY